MLLKSESNLKAEILTRGVIFTNEALARSVEVGAKRQNLIYNAPKDSTLVRPQELFLTSLEDRYCTVVSCVSTNTNLSPVIIDFVNDTLIAKVNEDLMI